MTPYLYLATEFSRYPDGLDAAHKMACVAAGIFDAADLPFFCPISHGHGLSKHGGIPALDQDRWLRINQPFIDHAAALVVWMTPTWKTSFGIGKEIDAFDLAGKRIFKVTPGPLAPWLISDLREALEDSLGVGVLGK